MTSFVELNRFKNTFNRFTAVLPFDFCEVFNIFRIRVFSLFSSIPGKLLKKLKTFITVLKFLTKNEMILKKTMVYGCLKFGTREKCVTLLVWI